MPEALATTKRKFHKLLDSRFGSTSTLPPLSAIAPKTTGSIETHTAPSEPAAKRIRSGNASIASVASTRHHQNTSSTSLVSSRSIRTVGRTRAASALPPPQPTREPPNFAPWSHETFLARLRTFSRVTLWHPKPEGVNEVQWAKRGWSCVDTNTVACKGGCGSRILVDVEPVPRRRYEDKEGSTGGDAGQDDEHKEEEEMDSEELEMALAERYKHLIIDGHAEGCLWRQAGCKADIYRLPIVKSTVWQPELRDRFSTLLKISTSFLHTHLKPDDIKPTPEKLLADLPAALLATAETAADEETTTDADATTPNTSPEARQKALLIAMTGWRGVTESGTELLCCDTCFQRIGLWMYQPDYQQTRFSTTTVAEDEAEEEQDHSLDLVDLHREHCPWRNAESQCATGDYAGLAAWEILHRVLARYADEHRRRSRGQVSGIASRAGSEIPDGGTETATTAGVGAGVGRDEEGESADGFGTELMPELTREETERLDKERSSRLKRLKSVFGFNKSRTGRPNSGLI